MRLAAAGQLAYSARNDLPDIGNAATMDARPLILPGLLVAATLAVASTAQGQPAADEHDNLFVRLTAAKLVEIPGESGWGEPYLMPLKRIEVGEEVIYTVMFANRSALPVAVPVVVCPLPAFMEYVPGSAIGPAASVSFSIDGGRSFARAAELTLGEGAGGQLATPGHYTHVRWVLDRPLAPGAVGYARFRARRVPVGRNAAAASAELADGPR